LGCAFKKGKFVKLEKKGKESLWWQEYCVDRLSTEKKSGHKAFILWFTGLSCAGKTTLANELVKMFYEAGLNTFVIDGDNVRHGLNSDLSFTVEDIEESNRRVAEVAKIGLDNGNIVVTALISPFRRSRKFARELNQQDDFVEVYCKAGESACQRRDRKGLYEKAKRGEVNNFIGIHIEYEEPANPEIIVNTEKMKTEACVKEIIGYLEENGYLIYSE